MFLKKFIIATAIVLSGASALRAQVPFDRGLKEHTVFVPKGEWITGVNVSYTAEKLDNYSFFVLEGLKGRGYTFKVSPMCLYSFADDIAGGARASYSRSLMKVDEGNLVLASDMNYDVDHLYSLSHTYGGTLLFRNYIALGQNTRFGIFNEVQLSFSGGQSRLASGSGQELSGTYQRNLNIGLGVTPGIIMFLNNYSALEVNIGVLGFNYHNTKATTDQIYVANMKRQSANFKINLFTITFGTVFYL